MTSHLKLLHLRPYGFEVGSVYKYARMLRELADVVDVVVKPVGDDGTGAAAIEREKPDLGLVGGDWWRHWQLFAKAGIPYILVEHDVVTLRTDGQKAPNERGMLEGAAAVLFTSEDHRDYCAARYDLPHTEVIHLRPLLEQIDFTPRPAMRGKHLVYTGGMVGWEDRQGPYGYRAYHAIFAAFIEAGWTVHAYPCYLADPARLAEYTAVGCVLHDKVPHKDLPREISRYTAGLQSYANEGCEPAAFAYCMTCRPNKTWDYLAAGIPTVGYNAGNTAEIYRGKWGVVLEDLADVADLCVADLPSRAKVGRYRQRELMEDDMPAFERLLTAAGDAGARMRAGFSREEGPEMSDKVVTQRRLYRTDDKGVRRLAYRQGAHVPIEEFEALTGTKVPRDKPEPAVEPASKAATPAKPKAPAGKSASKAKKPAAAKKPAEPSKDKGPSEPSRGELLVQAKELGLDVEPDGTDDELKAAIAAAGRGH